jgi:hypothetical protein
MDRAGQELVSIIRAISAPSKRDTMFFGEVASIDPLKIDIGNNIVLTEEFLFLGQMCRPHKVTIPHTHLVNAFMAEKTKGIITTQISAGVATDVQQTTGSYDVKTQEITRNEEKGTNERELKTDPKTNVDLGGATLKMSVNVTGSSVTGGSVSGGAVTAAVAKTTDLSTFTPTDNGHQHIIPEHETQDVHFPDTDYEDSVEMEIYPRLKVGDKVLMFAFNNYKKFYVAERIEED